MQSERCPWCGTDPLYQRYHDEEWGVPLHDERALFELLLLEGAQAGLSWLTVLRKREHYRAVFDHFDAQKMARYNPARMQQLLQNPGIIRNRLKVEAAVNNARCYLALREQGTSLDHYLWGFVEGQPIQNRFRVISEVPASTPLSATISRDLKQRGFRFVGPTIVYAFMQAAGIVNDHLLGCPRYQACQQLAQRG